MAEQDYEAPFLVNVSPTGTGVGGNVLISMDVCDLVSGVNINSLDAYVNGVQVFNGPSTFVAPYNGPQSSIVPISDGYRLILDNTGTFVSSTPYTVRVVVRDNDDNLLDTSFNFRTGGGIVSVTPSLYEITLDVVFSDNVFVDSGLTQSRNYVFDNGMYTRKVDYDPSTPNQVRLWVELFAFEETFTLTLGEGVKDSYGNSLPAPYNTISFSPFQSDAMLGNYNGKVRTWRESEYISADTYRIYLAGSKGIDVFQKEDNYIPTRWAQVFDEYGIISMYLAHHGGDYQFSDTDHPYFSLQNPFPGTTVPGNTSIQFILKDNITAVEIVAVTVYVNNQLAFRGQNSGWTNDYTGQITIGYQTLEFIITPLSEFEDGEEVEVRVICQDLLGNELDATYSFFIGAVILEDGFGGSAFGTDSFGSI